MLEGKSTSQASLVGRIEAETATVRAENSLLRTEMGVLTQNYSAIVTRIEQIESSIAARAQEDLVRAQTVAEHEKAIISLKDRSNTLKQKIRPLEVQIGRGDTSDAVLSQLAEFTRRVGELERAAGRVSGGQSTISAVARLRDQLTYVGRWVHTLCEQVWDIQRYTRRRSLHVVSLSLIIFVLSLFFLSVSLFSWYCSIHMFHFLFSLFRVGSPLSVRDLRLIRSWNLSDPWQQLTLTGSCRIPISQGEISLLSR